MSKGRLEAFSDGVIAILITIMVLEFKLPHGADFAALRSMVAPFLTYLLSFVYLGIYWNNHHHLLHATDRVGGKVLWANLHLLFWLSLIPLGTEWIGETEFAPVPTAAYGAVLLLSAIAWHVLQRTLLSHRVHNVRLAAAVGRDLKGKLSAVLYLAAVPLALSWPWAGIAIYVVVALVWLIPDTRIESAVAASQEGSGGSHGA